MAERSAHHNQSHGGFAEGLCRYIEKSGMSVKKLSAVTGLGRTAIQHTMAGKLMPARNFTERLLAALPITHDQRDELMEQYAREKSGDAAYYNRSRIKEMIETLPKYRISDSITEISSNADVLEGCTFRCVSGIMNVGNILRAAMVTEASQIFPEITAAMPFRNTLFFEMILQIFSASQSGLRFEHFFRMYACSEGEKNTNIDVLRSVLRIAVCAPIDYSPYYHYVDREWGEYFLAAYPYFMVTKKYSVLVSSDFGSALITDDKGLRDELLSHSGKIKSRSSLLLSQVDQTEMYGLFAQSTRFFHSSIEYQPCLTGFVTEDIVNRRLSPDIPNREAMLAAIKEQFFSAPRQDPEHIKIHFTKEGLLSFAETGKMTNMPGTVLDPLSPEERIAFLNGMKQMPETFILLSEGFSVPSFMQVICLSNGTVIISCLMEEKKFCCLLTEQGLSAAFEDLIDNLTELGLTENSEILDTMIDGCIEMIRRNEETTDRSAELDA